AFDAFVEEMYPVLLKGGKLAVPSREKVQDVHLLAAFIARHGVSLITCSPLLLAQLNSLDSYEPLCSIHTFISGGDVLNARFIDKLLKIGKVYNTYGPTESTVCITYYRCSESSVEAAGKVPIGKPIANYKVYLLDKSQCLIPIGVPGEICVAGEGVANGYLNNPELTADRFKRNVISQWSFVNGKFQTDNNPLNLTNDQCQMTNDYFYRTGDLARWLPDGNIEFLGRLDNQVKIRGFRIETGEIEARLLENPIIEKAVVVVRQDETGDPYLAAYFLACPQNGMNPAVVLRDYLARSLPDYMIPAHFIPVTQIPFTASGKVDRRKLTEMDIRNFYKEKYVAPTNEIEKNLASLWSEVLARPRFSIDDNFFQCGGHSLKASIMAARVQKILNVKIPLAEIFRYPTIRELSRFISTKKKSHYTAAEPAEKKEYYSLSPAQKRLYLVHRMALENTGYNITAAFELEGDIDQDKLQAAFQRAIHRHESFRTSFRIVAEEPVQLIHSPGEVKFEIESYDLIKNNDQHSSSILQQCIRPFDLSCAPLLRVELVKIAEKKHLLILDMHHIIADGVSLSMLVKEFTLLYAGHHVSDLKLQYKDYSEWQHKRPKKEIDEAAAAQRENYWLEQYRFSDIPVLNLPIDYPRPAIQSFTGSNQRFAINEEETTALRSLAAQEGTTVFILLLALFNVLLTKLSSQEDIIVGTPTAGRNHPDIQDIIGMFVNTLALRNYPIVEKPFHEFLREVKEKTLAAFENQDYPFENLVEQLKINRDTGRNPLFDVVIALQNIDIPGVQIPGLTLKPYEYEKGTAIFDMTWQIFESGCSRCR
ncbi:MAG: condensation domain-containing protein, partial [Acidobacteria bacterium]|nr:condensation domain-containing protein [Acidobacteriota bacterium]